jgi:FlgD Ig-like domain
MKSFLPWACLVVLSSAPALAGSDFTYEIPLPTTHAIIRASDRSGLPLSIVGESVRPLTPALDGPAIECQSVVDMITRYRFAYIPPDPNCAVGPSHVINATNGLIQWRPKNNPQDTPEFEQPLHFFFGLVPTPLDFVYTTDPKVIYDQYAGRFIIILMGPNTTWLLAVSKTSNPNDGWWRHSFSNAALIGGTTYNADYPGLAVDDEAIYLTANMFASVGGAYWGPYLWIIRKTPGAYTGPDGGAIQSSYDLRTLGLMFTTTQPAHTYGVVPSGLAGAPFGTFLVSYGGLTSGGNEFIRITGVNDPLGTAGGPAFDVQQVPCGNIDDTAATTTAAPQLGGFDAINSGGRQVFNAVWRNNMLYLAADVIAPSGLPDAGQVTAHWWQVGTTFDGINSPAVALADQGNVGAQDLGTGTHTYYPCVMVDAVGDLAVGFAASGSSIYAGAYFATRTPADPPGAMGPTCTLAAGVDYYLRHVQNDSRNRWGDYTGLALCPVDESTFWVYNEYAGPGGFADQNGQGLWHTKLGKFHVNVPLSIAITSFDATASAGTVTLRGAFRSGLGVEAVNVYRGGESGAMVQIESVLQGGSSFEYVDREVQPGATYRYRIGVVDPDGEFYSSVVTVSLDAAQTALGQNHPNPFNPTTTIGYSVAEAGPVLLDVYDAAGHLVRRLVDGVRGVGSHTATWDGRDDSGSAAGSGLYFYRLEVGKVTETRKMVLLK